MFTNVLAHFVRVYRTTNLYRLTLNKHELIRTEHVFLTSLLQLLVNPRISNLI